MDRTGKESGPIVGKSAVGLNRFQGCAIVVPNQYAARISKAIMIMVVVIISRRVVVLAMLTRMLPKPMAAMRIRNGIYLDHYGSFLIE